MSLRAEFEELKRLETAWLREKGARSARKAALKGSGPVPRFGG